MVNPVEAKAMAARPVPVSFGGAARSAAVAARAVAAVWGPTPRGASCVTPPACAADAMAFTGVVPEAANGRIAMLGFVAAMAAELNGAGTSSATAPPPLAAQRAAPSSPSPRPPTHPHPETCGGGQNAPPARHIPEALPKKQGASMR